MLIALDMATGALLDEYDVAILVSADTDLIPVVERVRAAGKRCEVAAWRSLDGRAPRLSLPGLWCHWLDEEDYERVRDDTDYTVT